MSRFFKYMAEGLDSYINLDLVQTVQRRKDDNRILAVSFGDPNPIYIYCETIAQADKMLDAIWGEDD